MKPLRNPTHLCPCISVQADKFSVILRLLARCLESISVAQSYFNFVLSMDKCSHKIRTCAKFGCQDRKLERNIQGETALNI